MFTANALIDNGSAFRWTAITVPDGKRSAVDNSGTAARGALDRIAIPLEVVTRISEIVEPGTPLIVTDKGPGSNRFQLSGNDFSVVTR